MLGVVELISYRTGFLNENTAFAAEIRENPLAPLAMLAPLATTPSALCNAFVVAFEFETPAASTSPSGLCLTFSLSGRSPEYSRFFEHGRANVSPVTFLRS